MVETLTAAGHGQSCTLMWDFTITVDSPTPHNRPDITLVDKQHDVVKLIDVAIPGDSHIKHKVVEKREKYTDLRIKGDPINRGSTVV